MLKLRNQNGGYYAIKGFTYQFDKSLLEVFNNPTYDVEVEQVQDICVNSYYIQVKYKETQSYSGSKIKPAIVQLLDCFLDDKSKKFKLYCYFRDRSSQKVILDEKSLDQILGSSNSAYTKNDKKLFLNNFILEFSENFEKQFGILIKLIKSCFQLKTEEEAMTYHAIFRANLFDIVIKKSPKQRVINFQKLKDGINNKEKVIFDNAYCKYLKNERYLKYLKKEYFTFNKVNIPNKDRLFIIEVDFNTKNNELLQIITNIKNRYFKKDSSPAPYICLYRIDKNRETLMKQKFWDKGLFFCDGTHFHGDKFRIKDILVCKPDVSFKLLSIKQMPTLFQNKQIDDVFVFLTVNDMDLSKQTNEFKKFYIKQTKDIIKIIQ